VLENKQQGVIDTSNDNKNSSTPLDDKQRGVIGPNNYKQANVLDNNQEGGIDPSNDKQTNALTSLNLSDTKQHEKGRDHNKQKKDITTNNQDNLNQNLEAQSVITPDTNINAGDNTVNFFINKITLDKNLEANINEYAKSTLIKLTNAFNSEIDDYYDTLIKHFTEKNLQQEH
jgi:hypothetical protein